MVGWRWDPLSIIVSVANVSHVARAISCVDRDSPFGTATDSTYLAEGPVPPNPTI